MDKKYSDKQLIGFILKYYEEFGVTPKMRDFDNNKDYPNSSTVADYFNTWSNAIKIAKLPKYKRPNKYTKEHLIKLIQDYYKKHNKVPSEKDILKEKDYPPYATFIRYFHTWNNAIIAAGFKINRKKTISKEEYMEEIKKFAKLLGRVPLLEDYKNYPEAPSLGSITHVFGPLNRLYRNLGWKFVRQGRYTEEELLYYLNEFKIKHGRPPLFKEFNNGRGYPDATIYARTFGTWKEALAKVGLKPIDDYRGRLYMKWQNFCEDVATALYGKVICQRYIEGIGYPDIYVPKENLIIDAMTSPYNHANKIRQSELYPKHAKRVEFWCLFEEGKKIENLKIIYIFPNDIILILENKNELELKKRLINFIKIRNDALKNEPDFYTKKNLLRRIKKYYNETGKIPSTKDWKILDNEPSITTYCKFFGSWSNAKRIALGKTNSYHNLTDIDILNFIKEFVKIYGYVPTENDFNNNPNFPSASTVSKKLGGWVAAVKLAGFKPYIDTTLTKEVFLMRLKEYYYINKKSPQAREFKQYQKFGKFNDLLREAGIPIEYVSEYTDEELLSYILLFYKTYKKIPNSKDFYKLSNYPSPTSYRRRFGSWNKAVILAGYIPKRKSPHSPSANFSILPLNQRILHPKPKSHCHFPLDFLV